MNFVYFDIDHAIAVHDEIIVQSGGLIGLLNIGLLEGTLAHVQSDLYYPEIEDKLTHLFYSINKNHSFQDGNKRAAIVLSSYFLQINGLRSISSIFIKRMENITVHIANNLIDKDLLFEIIYSILYENDYSEELKLKIFIALS